MKHKLIIFIILSIYSCSKDSSTNPIVSGPNNIQDPYIINLDWNNNIPRNKVSVSIMWNAWISSDSTEFLDYTIKDVTTEIIRPLDVIESSEDTTLTIDFPSGALLKLRAVVTYKNTTTNEMYYKSSDDIPFYTQPLSPVTDIDIDDEYNQAEGNDQHLITWIPSIDDAIDSIIIYKAVSNNLEEVPSLEISNGLPNGDIWNQIYKGDNTDSSFTDTPIYSDEGKHFYCINVQIQNQSDFGDASDVENFRYSLVTPSVDEMTDPIENHIFNLSASTNYKNYIRLDWDVYAYDDFYSYEIWRSEDQVNYMKLIEITTDDYNYFEDGDGIGIGKSWWYKIKVYNHFGNSLESGSTVEGYTRL